jgi:hypothetical protein
MCICQQSEAADFTGTYSHYLHIDMKQYNDHYEQPFREKPSPDRPIPRLQREGGRRLLLLRH